MKHKFFAGFAFVTALLLGSCKFDLVISGVSQTPSQSTPEITTSESIEDFENSEIPSISLEDSSNSSEETIPSISISSSEEVPSISIEDSSTTPSVSSTSETPSVPSTSVSETPSIPSISETPSVPSTSPSTPSVSPSISSSVEEPVLNYYKASSMKYCTRDVNNQYLGYSWPTLIPTGNQKFLVVPVQFNDGPSWTQSMLNRLYTSMFGAERDTSWHSVKSYYEESSYHQLHLTGEVVGRTSDTICDLSKVLKVNESISSANQKGENIVDKIIAPLFEGSNCVTNSKRKEYDQDNDGYIDATLFVYSNNYVASSPTAYWAWCSFIGDYPDSNAPTANNYMWASYSFMDDKYSNSYSNAPDAHTYIHEFGHIIGLDDLYDGDGKYDPVGQNEMQSYNVGDHGGFDKLACNWATPYVVTGETTISIRSSSSYGDFIVLPSKASSSNDPFNPYDEYILLEFYTPTGLNEKDAQNSYQNRRKMYQIPGVRIYHVDTRLGKITYKSDNGRAFYDYFNATYVNSLGTMDPYNYTFYFPVASNTANRSFTSNTAFKYLELMQNSSKNVIKNSANYKDTQVLFTEGSVFIPTSTFFTKGQQTWNSGSSIGYVITVDSITSEEATISFLKV